MGDALMLSTILVRSLVAAVFAISLAMNASAGGQTFSKDVGPGNASCDAQTKGSDGWRACVGAAHASMSDDELFYAGYWLAKNGRYADALTYLNLARAKDARVLTYIGFATRKQGDVDAALPLYAAALAQNPDFVVARAYLGEAYLTKNEPARAKAELAEIAARCGTTCAAFVDLDRHIRDYETAKG
jgi:tetratricopeptide (TPR) repeat protein